MPEFPGAVLLNHVGLRYAGVRSRVSCAWARARWRAAGGRLTAAGARADRRSSARLPAFLLCRRCCGCGRASRRRSSPSSFPRLREGNDTVRVMPRPPPPPRRTHGADWHMREPLVGHLRDPNVPMDGAAAARILCCPRLTSFIPCLASRHRRRLFVLGYFGGAGGVVAMAVADKKGRSGQPLTEEGVDDRAFREPALSPTRSRTPL